MGFRNGAYATVWSNEDKGKYCNTRISVSRKNKETGKYDQDFSGFVRLIGKAHDEGKTLKEKDRIKLVSTDVTTQYDKEKNTTYTNFLVFELEVQDGQAGTGSDGAPTQAQAPAPTPDDDFMNIPETTEQKLPF